MGAVATTIMSGTVRNFFPLPTLPSPLLYRSGRPVRRASPPTNTSGAPDFFVTGAGPMVEIFDDRIEITNPGEPLVDPQRFVDTPPRSRNEALASLMRRFRICEERGSGIDKVVSQVELFQLPAPLFESPEGFTRTVLFAHKPLSAMDKADRVRACYLHACLCFVTRKEMTNSTLRARFGVEEQNRSTVSRLLREAVEAGAIVPADPDAAPKLRRYLPFWAGARAEGRR